VASIDFSYLTDVLTPTDALAIIRTNDPTRAVREAELHRDGFPAYTTSAGWLGYSDEKICRLLREGMAEGWNHFKLKVGADIQDDCRRAALVRAEIGPNRKLMVDANQRWDVPEAINNIRRLAEFDLWWVEEPTSPDDVVGHATIAKAVAPIGIATGEMCQNRVIFKQLMQLDAIRFCQLDSCRLGGVNECLAVMLLAKKFGIPVCPHAGGVGLCEYVNHLIMVDYTRIGVSFRQPLTRTLRKSRRHQKRPLHATDRAGLQYYNEASQPGGIQFPQRPSMEVPLAETKKMNQGKSHAKALRREEKTKGFPLRLSAFA
jgi:L-fuconate dehydratase